MKRLERWKESPKMPIIECPWCDGPAAVDTAQDAVVCTDCGIAVAIAPDPVRPIALPLAA